MDSQKYASSARVPSAKFTKPLIKIINTLQSSTSSSMEKRKAYHLQHFDKYLSSKLSKNIPILFPFSMSCTDPKNKCSRSSSISTITI